MIPAFLVERFGPVVAKVILWLTISCAVILCLGVAQCRRDRQAHAAANLATGQARAAIDSGFDAVNVVGNRASAEAATKDTVKETQDAIHNANDSASAHAAGISGLCRLVSYRSKPECVQ